MPLKPSGRARHCRAPSSTAAARRPGTGCRSRLRGRSVSTVPESGGCNPMTARSRLDLPEPEGPTRLTKLAGLDGQARRLRGPARRHRRSSVRGRAACQPPAIVVSCSPEMLTPALIRPPIVSALLDPPGGVEVDGRPFPGRASRGAHDDLAEFLEIEPGGHLLRAAPRPVGRQLMPRSALSASASALAQRHHLRPALLDLLGAHRDAHELEGAAEMVFGVLEVHGVHQHARRRPASAASAPAPAPGRHRSDPGAAPPGD